MDKRRLPPIKEVTYIYVEPKDEEEAKERQRSLDRMYDEIFNAALEKRPINNNNL